MTNGKSPNGSEHTSKQDRGNLGHKKLYSIMDMFNSEDPWLDDKVFEFLCPNN